MPDSRRAKYLTMLAIVVGAGLALLASTQTWVTVNLTAAANHTAAVTVQGSAAAPALTALSLAGLALAAALAIAGRIVRVVLAVLGVVIAGCLIFSASVALADPVVSAAAAITSASGISGGSSVARLVDSVELAVWPWIAIAGGVVLAIASLSIFVTSRRWPGPSRKYQAVRFEDADSGDEVGGEPESRSDVTDSHAGGLETLPAADGGDPPRSHDESADDTPIDRDTAIDRWDELSRGEDPTR